MDGGLLPGNQQISGHVLCDGRTSCPRASFDKKRRADLFERPVCHGQWRGFSVEAVRSLPHPKANGQQVLKPLAEHRRMKHNGMIFRHVHRRHYRGDVQL